MKKLLIVAAVTVAAMGSLAMAEQFKTPEANTQQIANVDYGGMKYSTVSVFTTNHTTASTTGCVFAGVIFSSGNAGSYDFVDVWDATSAVTTAGAPNFRFYNVNGSTGVAATNLAMSASGWSGPRYPIRLGKGLVFRPSTNAYNSIFVELWREE